MRHFVKYDFSRWSGQGAKGFMSPCHEEDRGNRVAEGGIHDLEPRDSAFQSRGGRLFDLVSKTRQVAA
jgi:hypothetical protein